MGRGRPRLSASAVRLTDMTLSGLFGMNATAPAFDILRVSYTAFTRYTVCAGACPGAGLAGSVPPRPGPGPALSGFSRVKAEPPPPPGRDTGPFHTHHTPTFSHPSFFSHMHTHTTDRRQAPHRHARERVLLELVRPLLYFDLSSYRVSFSLSSLALTITRLRTRLTHT